MTLFKMYLSQLQIEIVQIAKSICPNCELCLSELQIVIVLISKCLCLISEIAPIRRLSNSAWKEPASTQSALNWALILTR